MAGALMTEKRKLLMPSWGLHHVEPSWWHDGALMTEKRKVFMPSWGLRHVEPSWRHEGSIWWSPHDGQKWNFSCHHEGSRWWSPHDGLSFYLYICLLVYFLFTCLHVYMFTFSSIYIKRSVSECVPFCLSPGGHTFLTHSWMEGGQMFFTHRGGQTFLHWGGGQTFLLGGGQIFFPGGGGGFDDVDEETDVSEANFLVSAANFFLSEF